MNGKRRNLLVKTRRKDGASSFRSSEDRSEGGVRAENEDEGGVRLSAGLEMTEDPFARAPPTIVKSIKKAVSGLCIG
jgi:hypothetical protein